MITWLDRVSDKINKIFFRIAINPIKQTPVTIATIT